MYSIKGLYVLKYLVLLLFLIFVVSLLRSLKINENVLFFLRLANDILLLLTRGKKHTRNRRKKKNMLLVYKRLKRTQTYITQM